MTAALASLRSSGRACRCGAPATGTIEVVRDPDHAARVVASVHGYLTAADFVRVPACDDCRRKDGTL